MPALRPGFVLAAGGSVDWQPVPRGAQRSVTNTPKYARSHVEGRSRHARALFLSSWSRGAAGAASPQPWKPENRSSVSHLRTRQGRRPQKTHPHTACLAGHAQTIGSANKMGTGTQNSPKDPRTYQHKDTTKKKDPRVGRADYIRISRCRGPGSPAGPPPWDLATCRIARLRIGTRPVGDGGTQF